ncbi:Uncharacterised protein [Acinetobacter baumannii]|nr:Uncharacterised protein [Acinetobacter baumannii]
MPMPVDDAKSLVEAASVANCSASGLKAWFSSTEINAVNSASIRMLAS